MPVNYTLDADAVQRTAAAVRYVEAMNRNPARPQRRRNVSRGGGSPVKKVTFVLPMALTSQASVSGCPVLNDWYSNAGTTSITALNEAGWQADAGAEGYAEYRPSDGQWVITLLPCPQGSS